MIKDFVGKIRGGSAKQKKAELAGLRKNRNQGHSGNEGAGNSGESLHIPEAGGLPWSGLCQIGWKKGRAS